jgi:hypothetical protein
MDSNTEADEVDGFWQFLDNVGQKAEENGMTEDLLNQLLSDN